MDMPAEMDDYIRESIEMSLGLPVSEKTLHLKILASEDHRHRLQDQIFVLQDRLSEARKRLDLYRAEASMNAQALKRCIEEKERMASSYAELVAHWSKLEEECSLYERDFNKAAEACDELDKENEQLRSRLRDEPCITALVAEVESLREDKEHLRVNLHRAEEEVNVLFQQNKILDEENKMLLGQLDRGRHHSTSNSSKGKRKSRFNECSPAAVGVERVIEFNSTNSPRRPLSPLPLPIQQPLHQSFSPNWRMHK